MYSKWASLKQLAAGRLLALSHEIMDLGMAYDRLVELLHPLDDVSYRFELCVNSAKHKGFDLLTKILPASPSALNDDSRLCGSDVGGTIINTLSVSPVLFRNNDCADISPLYPTAPILCSDSQLTDADYYRIIRQIFPAIMLKFRIHANLPIPASVSYVKDPNALNGNSLRYPKMTKPFQDTAKLPPQRVTFSKYGATYSIHQYIPVLQPYLLTFVILHLTSSTWSSYRTAWFAFFDFIKHKGLKVCLPASTQLLQSFAHYLYVWRNLKSSTINSYLSGLKKLHELNYRSTHCFDDPLLACYLTGLENYEALHDDNPFRRNVITFPVLRVLGHVIFT